jgi:hypothetical protein
LVGILLAVSLVSGGVSVDAAGTVLLNFQYQYDAGNRLASETDTVNGTSTTIPYTYDASNQLTSAGNTQYSYDPNGNRTMTGYQVGAGNELQSDGVWNFKYDLEGNLIEKDGLSNGLIWKYTWDDANHLLTATEYNASTGAVQEQETNFWDVFGNLIEQDQYNASTGTTTVLKLANQIVGLSSGQQGTGGKVLVHHRVAEAFAQQPALDRRLLGSGEPLDHLDAAPAGDVASQGPQRLVGVVARVGEGDGTEEGERVVLTKRLEKLLVGGLPEQAEQGDAELDRFPIRGSGDEEAGQVVQPLVADALLVDQRLDDRINDRDDVSGDDVLVDGGLVQPRGLPGVGQDQFHRPADGLLVLAGPHVVRPHPVHRPRRPANLRALADALLVGERIAVLGHPRLIGGDVGADELQDGGAAVPGHRRRLVTTLVSLVPEQSAQEAHGLFPGSAGSALTSRCGSGCLA